MSKLPLITKYFGIKDKSAKDKELFIYVFDHPTGVRMCLGKEPTDIHELELVETEDGPYWGWQRTDGDLVGLIFSHSVSFSICFPYGYQAEVERGKGRVVRFNLIDKGVHIKGVTG